MVADLASFWPAVDAAHEKRYAGLKGPRITKDDLKRGTGIIELIPDGRLAGPTPRRYRATRDNRVMGFGKHMDRPLVWVRDNDPDYWEWCVSSVRSFAARVRKAGLLSPTVPKDEEDAERYNPDDPFENGSWVPNH